MDSNKTRVVMKEKTKMSKYAERGGELNRTASDIVTSISNNNAYELLLGGEGMKFSPEILGRLSKADCAEITRAVAESSIHKQTPQKTPRLMTPSKK